jgi:uncharacterized OB-fold protein
MAEEKKAGHELIEFPIKLSIPQHFATGPTMGRFLSEIRDNKKIMANKCPRCGRTQIPPRIVCAECHVECHEWVQLEPRGVITTFDVTYVPTINPLTGKMREVPYTTGSVLLDGGDATLMHFFDVTDPEKIHVGQRCEAVFRPDQEREGKVTDILYFRVIPAEEEK